MSALPPKADIGTQSWNVRFVPKADICSAAKIIIYSIMVAPVGLALWWLTMPRRERENSLPLKDSSQCLPTNIS